MISRNLEAGEQPEIQPVSTLPQKDGADREFHLDALNLRKLLAEPSASKASDLARRILSSPNWKNTLKAVIDEAAYKVDHATNPQDLEVATEAFSKLARRLTAAGCADKFINVDLDSCLLKLTSNKSLAVRSAFQDERSFQVYPLLADGGREEIKRILSTETNPQLLAKSLALSAQFPDELEGVRIIVMRARREDSFARQCMDLERGDPAFDERFEKVIRQLGGVWWRTQQELAKELQVTPLRFDQTLMKRIKDSQVPGVAKPLLIQVIASNDPEGFFNTPALETKLHSMVNQGFRVVIVQAASEAELKSKCAAAINRYGLVSQLHIAGHGELDSIQLGYSTENGDGVAEPLRETQFLDTRFDGKPGNDMSLFAWLGSICNPDAQILLEACSTGAKGTALRPSIAEAFRAATSLTVFAPEREFTDWKLQFADKRLKSVSFSFLGNEVKTSDR